MTKAYENATLTAHETETVIDLLSFAISELRYVNVQWGLSGAQALSVRIAEAERIIAKLERVAGQ